MMASESTIRLARVFLRCTALLAIGCAPLLHAHEVPASVVIHAYLKADARQVQLLVRVPLEAMRDTRLPLRGPGYLELGAADEVLRAAATTWVANQVGIYAGDERLRDHRIAAVRVALPSDRSFESFEAAYASVNAAPLPPETDVPWNQALLDVLLEYPLPSTDSALAFEPHFAGLGLRTITVLHFIAPDGTERLFEFSGDPGMVRLDPDWHYALLRFVSLGMGHILDGTDHLLFVLCLVIPVRRLRPLVVIVTSFTVAHSITLLSAASGFVPQALWFPSFIEMLIAASIVYMAIENVVASEWRRRWLVAFGFGLVHGFGFSFALAETLQFAGSHLLTALLGFNLGVEIGQLLVILLAVPVLTWLFSAVMIERIGIIVLSVLIAHSAWHWMTERGAQFLAYDLSVPAFDLRLAASAMRWTMFVLIILSILWIMSRIYGRFMPKASTRAFTKPARRLSSRTD